LQHIGPAIDRSAALVGQKPEHFVDTMLAFRDRDRENDAYGRMRFIANQLTEDQIKALAAYHSLPPLPEKKPTARCQSRELRAASTAAANRRAAACREWYKLACRHEPPRPALATP
jgi:cytochrome c553